MCITYENLVSYVKNLVLYVKQENDPKPGVMCEKKNISQRLKNELVEILFFDQKSQQ